MSKYEVFSGLSTAYGDLVRKSTYSVRIRENLDIFHAVIHRLWPDNKNNYFKEVSFKATNYDKIMQLFWYQWNTFMFDTTLFCLCNQLWTNFTFLLRVVIVIFEYLFRTLDWWSVPTTTAPSNFQPYTAGYKIYPVYQGSFSITLLRFSATKLKFQYYELH